MKEFVFRIDIWKTVQNKGTKKREQLAHTQILCRNIISTKVLSASQHSNL